MGELHDAIVEAFSVESVMTLRQVYYVLVSSGSVEKTENQYDAIGRALVVLRENGRVPWHSVVDNTRDRTSRASWTSLDDFIVFMEELYFRSRWDNQPHYVEIWLEKDALAGVFEPVTRELDVSLMVVRGSSSVTFLHDAAQEIASQKRPCYLYYFGDNDPSGLDIYRDVQKKIRQYAPDADITFRRIAITDEQVTKWNLPTRPTKKTDSRAKNWKGDSIELDAIPPNTLRGLVRECIESHIDRKKWAATERAEQRDKERLASILNKPKDKKKRP